MTHQARPPPAAAPTNRGAQVRNACWATLFTNACLLPCLTVLAQSLKQHRTRYPLVVMVTEQVDYATRAIIAKIGCVLRPVEHLSVDNVMAFTRFTNVWTKLRVFELHEYDRVILLDSDMLVRRNMDELMDWPLHAPTGPVIAASFACTCNPNRIPTYPADWTPKNCAFTQRPVTSATASTFLPCDAPRTHHLLNGGLVLLEPTQEQADTIAAFLATQRDRIQTYRFPDQDLLADVYHTRFLPLPWKYNALKKLPQCHPQLWSDEEVCNVHFILDKPWLTGWPDAPEYDEDAQLHGWWWEAYHALQADPVRAGLTSEEWAQWIAVHVHDAPRNSAAGRSKDT